MSIEASLTIAPGKSINATYDGGKVEVETIGMVTATERTQATPRLCQHLADRIGHPVRHDGQLYSPHPAPEADGAEWGGAT